MNTRPTLPLTLDRWEDPPHRSQTDSFRRVQVGMRSKHPEKFLLLRGLAIRLATERGISGFTVDDLMREAGGRDGYPRNLPGVVLGSLRSVHAICVIARRKADHPQAKGRFVNVFKLNGDAIRVDE